MTERPRRKVLLVGWDAADWKVIHPLLDAGKLPTLAALVEGGVAGSPATLQPVLSPMLWTSIATGKRPYKHGVLGFTEPTPDGNDIRPVTSLSRTTKAVWNILNQSGLRSIVVGWWPSHPAEPLDGAMVSNHYAQASAPLGQPWPLPPGSVHPPRLQEILAEVRLHPSELTPAQVRLFVPQALEIDQDKDRRLAVVMKILAECTSVHAAATWLMEHEAWDFMAVYYDAIDHFCHGFMRYHPPRRPIVPERDFELYKGVVEAAYRYHDMMLRRLIELAGPETTVLLVSDHGFHADHLRPARIPVEPAGPAVEHRDHGIFVLNGPGIRRDDLVHGVSILDVAPTVLTLFGLPVGQDMDGRALAEAFVEPMPVATIPSWDAVQGDDGRHPAEWQFDPVAARDAVDQLVALGYVEAPDSDRHRAAARSARELRFNLARALMDGGLHGEAAAILEELRAVYPEEFRFGIQLAMCYRALDRIPELRALAESLHARRSELSTEARQKVQAIGSALERRSREEGKLRVTREEFVTLTRLRAEAHVDLGALEYLLGFACAAEGRHEAALEHLQHAERAASSRPGVHILIGETYLKLKKWDDAARAFSRALETDEHNPHAHLGLSRVHLMKRRFEESAEEALVAVGLLYQYPMAHFMLGRALQRLGQIPRAIDAFETAVTLNPNFAEAHRRLAALYDLVVLDPVKATEHRRTAAEIRAARRSRRRTRSSAPAPDKQSATRATRWNAMEQPAAITTVALQPDANVITVVSGLPRSGTSMLMRMLQQGGMPIVSDERRAADADNPHGYFEDARVTRLQADSGWLAEARGKAVKVVAPLLPWLPDGHTYRVVFIERDLQDVIASQRAMLARQGRSGARVPDERLARHFERQVARVKLWMSRQANVTALYLRHDQVIARPAQCAAAINAFLGGQLDEAAMAAAVDANLHRHRQGAYA